MISRIGLWAAVAIGVGATSAAALAADMPVKARPVVVAETYSWTGFYIGGHAGYAWGNTRATDTFASNGGCWFQCGFQWTARHRGFVGGGQVGYNWQSGRVVLGVEADFGSLSVTGSEAAAIATDTFVNTRGGFYATARGRLGVTHDAMLFYVTGGWIGAKLRSTVNDNVGIPSNTVNTSDAGFRSGWTGGVGLEYSVTPRWSVKGEWLYYSLGEKKVGGVSGTTTQFFLIREDGSMARLGLNYRFGAMSP